MFLVIVPLRKSFVRNKLQSVELSALAGAKMDIAHGAKGDADIVLAREIIELGAVGFIVLVKERHGRF